MFLRILVILSLGLLLSCSDKPPETASRKITYHNDYQIGRYTATEQGLYTNSFWIEGPDGVILIGTQLLPSDARQAVKIAESVTGKKVVMAIVLHASPDQFNGTGVLQKQGIRVVSAKTVVDEMAKMVDADGKSGQGEAPTSQPETTALPEALWDQTKEFDAAGLHMKAYVIRAGVSGAHLLIELDDHLFVGDLVSNGYHAMLQAGMSREWLERLEEIRRYTRHRVIHPGRGYAMNGNTLLNQQEDYLRYVQQAVAHRYGGAAITQSDRQAIFRDITDHYPDAGCVRFLDRSIPAVWARLRRDDHEAMQMEEKGS